MKVIQSQETTIKDFLKVLKTLKHPVANFYKLVSLIHLLKFAKMLYLSVISVTKLFQFHRGGHQLVADYKDLLLQAMNYGKVDVAQKLVELGVACQVPQVKGNSIQIIPIIT